MRCIVKDHPDNSCLGAGGAVRSQEKLQVRNVVGRGALRIASQMNENIGWLANQLVPDVRNVPGLGPPGVEQVDGAVTAQIDRLPAEQFHQDIARLSGRAPAEQGGDDFVDGKLVRSGENETRRPLLEKQLLERSELLQDRLLDRGRELAEKALEPFDDMEERRPDHSVLISNSREELISRSIHAFILVSTLVSILP